VPYYSVGFASVAAASGAAYSTIHTGSSYVARITEIGVACNAATASMIGLGVPGNTPVATTSLLGQAEQTGVDPASTVNVDTAWSTAPTVPAAFIRKFGLPATIGAGLIWTWPPDRPLLLPKSSWLCLWNFGASAGSVLNGYIKWLE
jgi:hypothetical protein